MSEINPNQIKDLPSENSLFLKMLIRDLIGQKLEHGKLEFEFCEQCTIRKVCSRTVNPHCLTTVNEVSK